MIHSFLFYWCIFVQKAYRLVRSLLKYFFRDKILINQLALEKDKPISEIRLDNTGKSAANIISELLLSEKPCMIARLGSTEGQCILEYLYSSKYPENNDSFKLKIYRFIYNNRTWWFDYIYRFELMNLSGFFPITKDKCSEYARLILKTAPEVDIFASSYSGEDKIQSYLTNAKIIKLGDLEPWYIKKHWTASLKGKKVLIIHPFAESIKNQYLNNRSKLFESKEILPDFNLITYKSVQSIVGTKTVYHDWFHALSHMSSEISEIDFDIAIIGCGAYGFPLAAKIKGMGKKAVIMGGATQILFGIKGKRWDSEPVVSSLYNEYWIRPLDSDKPKNFNLDEGGVYW